MIKMNEILKPGAVLKPNKINPNSKNFKKEIERVNKEIQKVMEARKIDLEMLNETFITI